MANIRFVVRKVVSSLGYLFMNLFTLPYYKFFRQNTLLPILAIAASAKLQKSDDELSAMLLNWRHRKLYELYFVQVAAALLSAAVIGCFSWESLESEYWIGPAARYCSLVLSLFAILLSASQSFIFTTTNHKQLTPKPSSSSLRSSSHHDIAIICHIIKAPPQSLPATTNTPKRHETEEETSDTEKGEGAQPSATSMTDDVEVHVRWNMVFTWRAPIMLLAYSVLAFLVGLTTYVCTPLYSEGMGDRGVAVFYLVSLGVGGFCFIWCSFWAY